MSEIKNNVSCKNKVLYNGPNYFPTLDNYFPRTHYPMDLLRTSTPVRKQPGEVVQNDPKNFPILDKDFPKTHYPMDFPRTSTPIRKQPGEDLRNDDDVPIEFPRTSTPIPNRKHPRKVTNYSINIGYEKWSEKLKNPPTRLRIKGVTGTLQGIISGHLVPFENNESNLPPLTKNMSSPLPKVVNHNTEKKFHIPKKIKSIFKIPGKSLLQKTCLLLKPKNKDTCISGYPKCTCKLNGSIMGNYNIAPPSR